MKQTKIKDIIERLWITRSIRIEEFLSLLEKDTSASLIDLGCCEGEIALRSAHKIGINVNKVWGVEIEEKFAREAEKRGIRVIRADLNGRIPVNSNSFDVVTSDQVIEHLINIDLFVKELYRILKHDGYAVISTENLASWHNIFALILGLRPFSVSYSTEVSIGNPLSFGDRKKFMKKTMTHVKVLTCRSFKELFKIHGFYVEKIIGTGYYPFPKAIQRPFSRIDPTHAHYLTMKVRKRN